MRAVYWNIQSVWKPVPWHDQGEAERRLHIPGFFFFFFFSLLSVFSSSTSPFFSCWPPFSSKVTDCLTSVRSVNKTDVVTLASTFGVFFIFVFEFFSVDGQPQLPSSIGSHWRILHTPPFQKCPFVLDLARARWEGICSVCFALRSFVQHFCLLLFTC